ncbi:major facilitator superfamily domain-containing protein [Collybia nuda]|uniref:Major facilitator superfamily domain-containing protein n=1 Tax=Collybia nuda TaxID=64659 RepID=A0A9P5Y054_9AGAR|nr:major facilitator superfamily domain-containing protein [Collybia nuda]
MKHSTDDHYSKNEKESEDHTTFGGLGEKVTNVKPSKLHRTALWKLDTHVLPVVIVMLFLSSLDRNNVGNARVAGLQQDLGLSNSQYSIVLTVNSITALFIMIPANLMLKKIGANVMLPALTVLWGFTAMLQGFVTSYAGLLSCRFFLGIFVGGEVSCVALYLSSMYPRFTYQLRLSLYFAISSFAGAFSGLLAAAIIKLDGRGGRPGWSWILILEGLFTIVFGLISVFLLPASVENARVFTEKEKEYLVATLKEDGMVARNPIHDQFRWSAIVETFKRPHLLSMALACFFGGTTETGLAYFEPSIIQKFHYSPSRIQLMSVPPFAVAFVLAGLSGYLSDKYKSRGYFCIIFTVMATVGFAMFLGRSKSQSSRALRIFLSLPGTYCAAPMLATWTANNVAPHTRRATSLALNTMMTSVGAILSIWLLGFLSPAPRYTKAAIVFIVFSVLELACSIPSLIYCTIQNTRKAELRETAENDDRMLHGDESPFFVFAL